MRSSSCSSFLVALLAISCAPEGSGSSLDRGESPGVDAVRPASGDSEPSGPLVIFLGDSLTAGFGLAEADSFPAVIERRLLERGRAVRIVNAGISGDTTAGGRARVDWLLSQDPDIVVVGLGANDALRGLSLAETADNLRAIVQRCLDRGAEVLLLGMKIPPSYGPEYSAQFETLYAEVAADLEVPLVPFLLQGVAADPELNLADGIHPNSAGQEMLAQTVLRHLEPLLSPISSRDRS